MKVQVEVSILEKSVLTGLIENCIEAYLKGPKAATLDKRECLKIISEELEKVKELNLISFYGVSSHVSLEQPNREEK